MEEIKIQIEVLEMEMQSLTNKVDDYSRYNRSPNENDYIEIIKLLENWAGKRQQLIALEEVLNTINSNAKYQK